MAEQKIYCGICKQRISKDKFWDHVSREHVDYLPYTCLTCSTEFVSVAELTLHEDDFPGHFGDYSPKTDCLKEEITRSIFKICHKAKQQSATTEQQRQMNSAGTERASTSLIPIPASTSLNSAQNSSAHLQTNEFRQSGINCSSGSIDRSNLQHQIPALSYRTEAVQNENEVRSAKDSVVAEQSRSQSSFAHNEDNDSDVQIVNVISSTVKRAMRCDEAVGRNFQQIQTPSAVRRNTDFQQPMLNQQHQLMEVGHWRAPVAQFCQQTATGNQAESTPIMASTATTTPTSSSLVLSSPMLPQNVLTFNRVASTPVADEFVIPAVPTMPGWQQQQQQHQRTSFPLAPRTPIVTVAQQQQQACNNCTVSYNTQGQQQHLVAQQMPSLSSVDFRELDRYISNERLSLSGNFGAIIGQHQSNDVAAASASNSNTPNNSMLRQARAEEQQARAKQFERLPHEQIQSNFNQISDPQQQQQQLNPDARNDGNCAGNNNASQQQPPPVGPTAIVAGSNSSTGTTPSVQPYERGTLPGNNNASSSTSNTERRVVLPLLLSKPPNSSKHQQQTAAESAEQMKTKKPIRPQYARRSSGPLPPPSMPIPLTAPTSAGNSKKRRHRSSTVSAQPSVATTRSRSSCRSVEKSNANNRRSSNTPAATNKQRRHTRTLVFPRADTVREDHRLEIENLDSDASWESDFPDEEEIFVNFNNSGNKNTNSSRSASDSSDPDYNLPSASSSSKKTNKNKRGRKKRGRTVSADGRRRSTAGSKNLAGADGMSKVQKARINFGRQLQSATNEAEENDVDGSLDADNAKCSRCKVCKCKVSHRGNQKNSELSHINTKHTHLYAYQCRLCGLKMDSLFVNGTKHHLSRTHGIDTAKLGNLDTCEHLISRRRERIKELKKVRHSFFDA